MGRRLAIGLISLSAAGLVALAVSEGYREQAYLPTPNDVPTVGFGSTRRPDGSPVRPGDTTTPVRAIVRMQLDVSATERALRECIGDVALNQGEWDAYVSLAYNIGPQAFCGSTITRLLHQSPPDYAGACAQISRWIYQGRRPLPGLIKRRAVERATCEGGEP